MQRLPHGEAMGVEDCPWAAYHSQSLKNFRREEDPKPAVPNVQSVVQRTVL